MICGLNLLKVATMPDVATLARLAAEAERHADDICGSGAWMDNPAKWREERDRSYDQLLRQRLSDEAETEFMRGVEYDPETNQPRQAWRPMTVEERKEAKLRKAEKRYPWMKHGYKGE